MTMRKELKPLQDLRGQFTGTFVRIGTKNSYGYLKQTLLLKDVMDRTGKVVTDHLWFNLTKGFAGLGLTPGDVVQFDARVRLYEKGYRGYREDVYKPIETDYKLSHPTRLKKVEGKNALAESRNGVTTNHRRSSSLDCGSELWAHRDGSPDEAEFSSIGPTTDQVCGLR
jgi:hypothetical protein